IDFHVQPARKDPHLLRPSKVALLIFATVVIADLHYLQAQIMEGEAVNAFSEITQEVYLISSAELINTYDVSDYYEELGEEVGHIPYTDEFFISLATIISRKIKVSFRSPFKAIAVDCDNTLWKGVIAEDGPSGVTIGEPERALQEFLVDQFNSGILICLCSKNIEKDVFEVFEKNSQMVLKKEHIAFYRINWNPKSQNLIQLAKEINIGLDSFVFIDDSPVECAEVKNGAPEVLTVQLPGEGFTLKQLQNSWIFDRLSITAEDRVRSEKYREEAVRINYKSSVKSYSEFIKGLDLQIEVIPFRDEDIPRISQLTYKTNQFNFTTLKRSEAEIKNISKDYNFECFQVSLSDRFGDYGLIGVIIVDKQAGYSVDTFLLSCRVLGKGVEHTLISFLGQRARVKKSSLLSVQFRKTVKNIPAQDFLVSNFGEPESVSDGLQIFNIPFERAVGFTFDPERTSQDQIAGAEEKAEVAEGAEEKAEAGLETTEVAKEKSEAAHSQSELQVSHDFYYMILDRYLSLGNLVAEMNAMDPERPERPELPELPEPGSGSSKSFKETEKNVMSVWQQVLKSENFSSTDNFFDIGGHSVLIPQIVIKLFRQYKLKVDIVDIFQFPTVRELASFIDNGAATVESEHDISIDSGDQKPAGKDIAIIGMAGRFSGVSSIEDFWNTISSGKETITYYTKEELLKCGVDKSLLENRDYVLANGNMDTADQFDSSFFGITPREADFMDPQHRVFLESCYEALENAGYTSENYSGDIGVFAGSGMNNYLLKNLFQHPESLRSMGEFQTIINNNSDYLTTRVSYKLNLTGPSIDIQTACSTSLVAIHIACQNLIGHNCDIALAGGVFIPIPRAEGYMYEPGGIFSSNGHCRPFDSEADGTLFGEGSGVVVLKRLDDAIRDRDTISAVIKGSAINNDGSGKVGYMAPSVTGQTAVVRKALAAAGVPADSVSYIETHGTGTKLGDPIEVSALNQLFKKTSDGNKHCALGSVKANIGHLDAAAGVAGMIKVVMMLKNRKLPPQINYNKPNSNLPLKDSKFYINTSLKDWEAADSVRRAGVSSFGIGGTNAHCILEEAPATDKTASAKEYHLLPVTAKTPEALKVLEHNISQHILTSGQDIGDISFTLQQGRSHYMNRSLLVYKKEPGEEPSLLMTGMENRGKQNIFNPKVVFMFTGQGSQYVGMAEDLYNEFSSFRDIVDNANLYLQKNFNLDILKYILQTTDDSIKDELNQTSVAQPLLFVVQYAISRLLKEFGITPDALIGHSIGEYTAATVSGVFEFEDALKLVAWRGKLMQAQKPGAMLSVQLPHNLVLPYVSGKVNLSLKNAPDMMVLSGKLKDIKEVHGKLAADYPEIHLSRLKTSHAFHSYMMEPVIKPFNDVLNTIRFG
ncbi:MAG: HAD-IIIC family phosphatase, partial [Bacteroidales bacterium]